MHVAQRQRGPRRRRPHGARHRPDLALSCPDSGAAIGNAAAVHDQPDQPPRDSPVPAMQHADDDFLPDVTAFGQADRAILDARFERDGVLVHVGAEPGHAGFDPEDFCDVAVDGGASPPRVARPSTQPPPPAATITSKPARPTSSRRTTRAGWPRHSSGRLSSVRMASSSATRDELEPSTAPTAAAAASAHDADLRRRCGVVHDLDVLAEDEAFEVRERSCPSTSGSTSISTDSPVSMTRMSAIIRPCAVRSAA